jgi:hypothetical protein
MLVRSASHLRESESDLSAFRRPLTLGLSVGHPRGAGAGSIGGFAASKADPEIQGLLSSATALCPESARVGDFVHQPGAIDNRIFVGETRVARLEDAFPPAIGPRAALDVGFAVLLRDVSKAGNVLPEQAGPGLAGKRLEAATGPASSLTLGERVAKIGRGTGLTFGVVSAAQIDNFAVTIGDSSRLGDGRSQTFNNVIEIKGESNFFSGPGDSGAALFSLERLVVLGLLFASSRDGDHGRSYAHPVARVLETFGLVWL